MLLPLVRLVAFGSLLVCSFVVLGLDAYFIAHVPKAVHTFDGIVFSVSAPSWAKIGLASAVLTAVSIPPMIVIDFLRKGAPTSFVVTELVWLGLLWILWLSSAADAASSIACNEIVSSHSTICQEAQASMAFAFLAWLTSMFYWGALLILALRAHQKGNVGVWTDSVSDAKWGLGVNGNGNAAPSSKYGSAYSNGNFGGGRVGGSGVDPTGRGGRYGVMGEAHAPEGYESYQPTQPYSGVPTLSSPTPQRPVQPYSPGL